MNNSSRTKNAVLNLLANFGCQAIIILLSFFSRRVFIESLGIEYLGISSLFTNILNILNFTELGISAAINYTLYKLIADKDNEGIKGIITYYKKLYNKIAIIIFVLGILFIPFLDLIINVEHEIKYLKLYYFVELISTVSSYLFVYKTSIVTADQKGYKFKGINIAVSFLRTIVQCLILVFFKNYLAYIIIAVVFSIAYNVISSMLATRWYPIIKEKGDISDIDKKNIWSNIKDMFIYKLAGILINNTDNVLISVMINTATVGLYSNYTMVVNKLNVIVSLFFNSITASVGNLNANSTKEKQFEFFNVLLFVSFCLMYISTVGLVFVGEDIILTFTQTKEYLFNGNVFLIIILSYYTSGINYPIWIYRTTTGLFKMAKWSILVSVFINMILSVILGNYFGLIGIIGATLIARVLTTLWYEPYLLYKKIFNVSPVSYYLKQLLYSVVLIVSTLLISPLISRINFTNLYFRIIFKSFICFIIPIFVIICLFCKTPEFKYLLDKGILVYNKLKSRELKGGKNG